MITEKFCELFGNKRDLRNRNYTVYMDIAASIQRVLETVFSS